MRDSLVPLSQLGLLHHAVGRQPCASVDEPLPVCVYLMGKGMR